MAKEAACGTAFKKPTQPQRKAGMKRHSKRQSNGKSTTIQTTGIKRQSTKNRTATKSQSNANRKQSNGNLTARAVENERPRTRDQDKHRSTKTTQRTNKRTTTTTTTTEHRDKRGGRAAAMVVLFFEHSIWYCDGIEMDSTCRSIFKLKSSFEKKWRAVDLKIKYSILILNF